MKCPKCGIDNNIVIDTRERKDFHRRVRQCINCGHKFATREEVVDTGYHVKEIRQAPKWLDRQSRREVDWKKLRDTQDKKMKQIEDLINANK